MPYGNGWPNIFHSMKFTYKIQVTATLALLAMFFVAPVAQAAEAAPAPSFFSVSSIIKNLFQKNVTEKKENLEKNRDIRNKLIEEKQNKLNVKFNQPQEEPTPEAIGSSTPEEKLVIELQDQMFKLSDIKVRIDSQIVKIQTEKGDILSVTKALDFSTQAGIELDTASTSLNFFISTSTPAVDASTTPLYESKKDALLDSVKSIKNAHVYLIEAVTNLAGSVKETASTTLAN